jgi:hypothetical protein
MEEILLVCLLIVVFLIVLDGFLNGALKTRIDAVLSVALLCVLGAMFYWFSWKGLGTGVAVALTSSDCTKGGGISAGPSAENLKLLSGEREGLPWVLCGCSQCLWRC